MNLIYRAEKEAVQGEETPYELSDITPVIGGEFAEVKLLDKKDACENAIIDCGGFTGTDTELQCVEMDDSLTPVPEFPYNWMYDGSVSEKPYFEMKLDAKAILLIYKDSGAMDVAKADVYVDGKKYFLQIRMKMAGCTVIQRLSVRKKKAESIRSGYRLLRGMSIRNLRF